MSKTTDRLRDMSGTTLALTSLAVLSAAAVVSTPVWIWYRRKRKRTDVMANTPPASASTERRDAPQAQGEGAVPEPEAR